MALLLLTSTSAKDIPIAINFKDLEITNFVKMVSKIIDKNILLPVKVPGKVNFVSVKPIYKHEIYDLLNSILRSKGFTLIDSDNGYLEVVRGAESSQTSPSIVGSSMVNQIQTEIVGVKNLDAVLLLPQVKFLQSKYGKGIVSKKINALVLTDYPKNIKVIKQLVKKMDTKETRVVEFVKLKHASSMMALPKLIKIVTAQYDPKIASQKVELLQDEGSNTLIIIAKKTQVEVIKGYIKALDKNDEVAEERITIIALKKCRCRECCKNIECDHRRKTVQKRGT